MSIKALETTHLSSGKSLRVSRRNFYGFRSEIGLWDRAFRSCPVVGRRRDVRRCPGVNLLRAVRSCFVVESLRAVEPCPVFRGPRALGSFPSVNSCIFMSKPNQTVSSSLDLRSSLIYKFKEPSPVQWCRDVRFCPVVGSYFVEPNYNQSVRSSLGFISTSAQL